MQVSTTNQKNTEASIRNLEVQIRQLAKQLADQQSNNFSANTQVNPKEHFQSITTRRGMPLSLGSCMFCHGTNSISGMWSGLDLRMSY
uniref:Uncharacterized protein n=1 Tax=Cajanus cajan TaxID=3821 RepID=A0A151SG29_CAJCA|nr:hypothetical protein KK1_024356 [Cajanus cajan]